MDMCEPNLVVQVDRRRRNQWSGRFGIDVTFAAQSGSESAAIEERLLRQIESKERIVIFSNIAKGTPIPIEDSCRSHFLRC